MITANIAEEELTGPYALVIGGCSPSPPGGRELCEDEGKEVHIC